MPRPDDRLEKPKITMLCRECLTARRLSRRAVLKSALGLGLGLHFTGLAVNAADDPKRSRPQVGDVFVFSLGDRRGQVVTFQDLSLGGPPVVVYPMDSETQAVRDGSRLNRVLLVRLAQETLTEQTRAAAAEGIVAYSAVCTHTGCDVSGWRDDVKHFVCPCHASAFDPKDRSRVIGGPASRPLAALPLRLVDGKVTVAGLFSGRVGAEQK